MPEFEQKTSHQLETDMPFMARAKHRVERFFMFPGYRAGQLGVLAVLAADVYFANKYHHRLLSGIAHGVGAVVTPTIDGFVELIDSDATQPIRPQGY